MKLKRKQIYLDVDSDRKLKAISAITKTPESEHIRKAIKLYLLKKRIIPSQEDPILKLIGLCDNPEGPKDASIHHDRYLYGKKR